MQKVEGSNPFSRFASPMSSIDPTQQPVDAQIDNDDLPHDGGAMDGNSESRQPPGDTSPGPLRTVLAAIPLILGRIALGLAIPLILVVILAFVAQMVISSH